MSRVRDAQRGADTNRRNAQAPGPYRRSGERQDDVDADGAQQCALPRHVRAADDQKLRAVSELDVVANHSRRWNQRMAEAHTLEQRRPLAIVGQLRKWVVGVLVEIRGKRRERLELTGYPKPFADVPAVRAPPGFDRQRQMS